MVRFNVMVIVAFVVLLAVLLIQNSQFITFKFLVWTAQVPEVAAILLMVVIGFVLGFISAKSGKKKPK